MFTTAPVIAKSYQIIGSKHHAVFETSLLDLNGKLNFQKYRFALETAEQASRPEAIDGHLVFGQVFTYWASSFDLRPIEGTSVDDGRDAVGRYLIRLTEDSFVAV